MSIIIPFSEVRNQALIALYRLIYSSDEQQYFTKGEVATESCVPVGAVFFGRVLDDLTNEDLVSFSVYEEGAGYYTLTNSGWEAAEKLALASLRTDGDPVEGVPASDRVVLISDNQRRELLEFVDELTANVAQSNEVGVALGESKDRVLAELQAGRKLAVPSHVRLGAIVAVLATPLRFLASKFSGDAVGEFAKKLLDLLWTMMNR